MSSSMPWQQADLVYLPTLYFFGYACCNIQNKHALTGAASAVLLRLLCCMRAAACAGADDPLVGSIAQQYLTDRDAHDKTAADWVKRFAQG